MSHPYADRRKKLLDQVIDVLKTRKADFFKDYLKDLPNIFHGILKSDDVNDRPTDAKCHEFFEILFEIVIEEKRKHLLPTKSNRSTDGKPRKPTAVKSTTKLEQSTKAICSIVEAGIYKFKKRTVNALIIHIIDTIPTSTGDYFQPIVNNYLKTLSYLLERPANAAGVKDVRTELIEFSINGIELYLGDTDEDLLGSDKRISHPSLPKTFSELGSIPKRSNSVSEHDVEALCQILIPLLSTTNDHSFSTLERVGTVMMRLLQYLKSNVSTLHRLAFSVLNIILSSFAEEYTSFSFSIGRGLVPLICRLWQGKSLHKDEKINSVRDEMLISLYHIHLHLESNIMSNEDVELESNLNDLLDALRADYSRRENSDQLQLDDVEILDLSSRKMSRDPFRLHCFRLKSHNNRTAGTAAERNWANLLAMAILERLVRVNEHIHQVKPKVGSDSDDSHDSDNHPRKRQRISWSSEGLLDPLKSGDQKILLAGLQLIPFLLQDYKLQPSFLKELLVHLGNCALDKRGNIASWALLGIASCTYQVCSADESSINWKQLWHNGAKSLTFAGTCRAAALALHAIHAKHLVDYRDIEDSVNAIITTADISGPPVLCESSIFLVNHLLQVKVSEAPGASLAACQHVICWLFGRWNPAERLFIAQYGKHLHPFNFVALLRTSLGLPSLPVYSNGRPIGGALFQAWQQYLDREKVLRFLLLLDGSAPAETDFACRYCPKSTTDNDVVFKLDSAHFSSARRLIIEFLASKCSELLQIWRSFNAERSPQVSTDMYRGSLNACIISLELLPHFDDADLEQLPILREDLRGLGDELLEFLRRSDAKDFQATDEFVHTLLQTIQPHLPPCDSTQFKHVAEQNPQLLQFLSLISEDVKRRRLDQESSSVANDDPMDIDDDFPTQRSQSAKEAQNLNVPRRAMGLEMSSSSFFIDTIGRLMLVSDMNESPESCTVPTSFIDALVSMKDEEILSCRSLIRDVLQSDLVLVETDAYHLFERVGHVLSSDDFLASEIAMCACLDVMIGLLPFWSMEEQNSFVKHAKQLYDWFILRIERSSDSTVVQLGIVNMLLQLLRANQNYGNAPPQPSPRTSLLKLLEKGNTSTKFFIGDQISEIFELLTLKEHDKIFVDVLDLLPSAPEIVEGIAFRLYVLAKLASRWSTLLRRCIYHIFETPGRISGAVRHATWCLSYVASALAVASPQELFALFAPQILYTWLEVEAMDDIPYQIFGFAALRDLLVFAQEETCAIIMMRGYEAQLDHLAELLNVPATQLLQTCFSKAMAYCIANNISIPPSSDKKRISGEARLKNRLGKELFLECVNLHFTDILATLFNVIDQEQHVENSFAKDENLVYAAKIMVEIKSLSSSEITLPPGQQPAFKAKYLLHEIKHLCTRTLHEAGDLYTPSLVAFIARKLLRTIHPALGSLHACSVLRKLRVLISLAGNAATQGYPLEMLLRSIRPYIKDPECADDAIGILQYLLIQGSEYLKLSPSFVASITLSILGSLRVFMQERRSSTTQESQHQATMSKAQKFHLWVGKYASRYDSPALAGPLSSSFKSLVASAQEVRAIGNAEKGTIESTLLDRLLEDEKNGGTLLTLPARKLALSMLCSEFECPTSFRTDIYGEDAAAEARAAVVWKSCRGNSSNKQYMSWAARVLGRAFAATGHVHHELLQESTLSKMKELKTSSEVNLPSRACILSILQSILLGDDSSAAGIAETTLRIIVTTSDQQILEISRQSLPPPVFEASAWNPYPVPPCEIAEPSNDMNSLGTHLETTSILSPNWLQNLSIALVRAVPKDPILCALAPVLRDVPEFADQAFPFILHLVLSTDLPAQKNSRNQISNAFAAWFSESQAVDKNNLKTLINSILYLRTQPLPHEKSSADRLHWLDLDYLKVATAAIHCGMFKTALIFVEEHQSIPVKSSRRSLTMKDGGEAPELPSDLLLAIFENIDDPDLYYGVQQTASLSTILARLEYEKDGPKSLAFRGAQYDSHIKQQDPRAVQDAQSLVKALDMLSLSGLSLSLLQAQQSSGVAGTSLDSMFRTARKLEQWDIPVPASDNHSVTIYKAFQAAHVATNRGTLMKAIDKGLEGTMERLVRDDLSASALHESLRTLAALSEMDEVLSSHGSGELEEVLSRFRNRSEWMKTGRFDDISQMISCRGTTLSTLSQQPRLRDILNLSPKDTRLVEVHVALISSSLNRAHGALQESLSLTTSLIDLIKPCQSLGMEIEAAVHMETADALWEQGEMTSSIGILRALDNTSSLKAQTISVGRPDLLSKIGHQVSEARLEKPDRIIEKYLKPALKDLKTSDGHEAAKVFHQFAVFCDQQLQDPDSLKDLERMKKLSEMRSSDVADYEELLRKATSSTEKARHNNYLKKAKTWLGLDEREYRRHCSNRDEFLRQCLENYLLALAASDNHDSNALRFTALWLEHSAENFANEAVAKILPKVPSRKFATLMNQLSSRLLDNDSKFQRLLFNLVLRICTDHPYHGMYQIYAGSHSRPNTKDEIAISRNKATLKVSEQLQRAENSREIWAALGFVIQPYTQLAGEKDEQKYKTGKKLSIKDSPAGLKLNNIVRKYSIPPPTIQIDLRADKNYSKVPKMVRFESQMSIASGVSAPKIITAVADNGARFKQLVKGGNDDLRQDAIMEQVFAQVSELLKTNRATRQRNLSIRTYKVLPLTSIAGVIEFVPSTIPLHEYLMPAHERFYPKDLKGTICRKEIGEVQGQPTETRIKKFRWVTDRFHPVMHCFFTEHFNDPDEWFTKRLAYTRSTAAISILGHVLGLGDRHGHNILLDFESGEVVHIDLGVAFEMGRVLPVPELVPFRLTRDIVDGMGITKTEGVFRRCCEFTLSALRKEVYSIMTILDVLRYDPLYSWSISPVRLAKLQVAQSVAPEFRMGHERAGEKQAVNQPSEADKALTVVNKKLSKTLSVEATVNDLINQASDERNLAVLYSGWAAYA
ncbi:hypothetical protein sscle_07g058230 [Sclerotinia sclerotiorum 1980 UF-70]|uniref:Serine/threonine-protein kinase Tel1 n=1 Tax=Sclerotinia sclerotiorum (strain ATCC 18683 / 1980 / Ss-1) TaxID=665079 RepID=A0A1D9Q8Y7_SCLS1|nr:hypothetical protein sscle_07g058230 [Sclerotinia sclerotiorum 1980 UF-70]